MCAVIFPDTQLKKWDKIICNLISNKLKIDKSLGYLHLSLQKQEGGLNLNRLTDLQLINTPSIFLNYVANGIDKHAQAITKVNISRSPPVLSIQNILENLKLNIHNNPAWIDPDYAFSPEFYLSSSNAVNKLSLHNIKNIKELIGKNNTIHHCNYIQDNLVPSWTNNTHNQVKIDLSTSLFNPEIPYNIAKWGQFKHTPALLQKLHWDNDYYAHEAFVDESLKDNKSAWGVFWSPNHPWNKSSSTLGRQTLQNATFQAVEYILLHMPNTGDINIYIDQESALKVLNNLPLKHKDLITAHEADMIRHITELIKNRSGKTNFKQVYSHLDITPNLSKKRLEKINLHLESMKTWYGVP